MKLQLFIIGCVIIFVGSEDDKIYVVETYQYRGSGNQTTYTKIFSQNTLCDILVVGGGAQVVMIEEVEAV
jgi:hypothetical protein